MGIADQLVALDRRRPGIPGEHWAVAALGTALLRSAFRRKSGLAMALTLLAAGALLYRAASGRDGIARLIHRDAEEPPLPEARRIAPR